MVTKRAEELRSNLATRFSETGMRWYFLAFHFRCGSTLLANDLHRAGLGSPQEFFQEHGVPKSVVEESGVAHFQEHLLWLLDNRTQGGLFGAKITWEQHNVLLHNLSRELEFDLQEDLRVAYPSLRFIYMTREDPVRQAVSLWRAGKTNQWFSFDPSPDREPDYDYHEIAHLLRDILLSDWLWNRHFSTLGIAPFRLTYEQYVKDRRGKLGEISNFLTGRPLSESVSLEESVTSTKVQANAQTAVVLERFYRDLHHLGVESYWEQSGG